MNSTLSKRGTTVSYLLARLERDGELELLEEVRGNRMSAYAAAVTAGYVRRRRTVAREDCPRRTVIDPRALIG